MNAKRASIPEATETQILCAILDYLAARRILGFRMNTGQMVQERGGRKRVIKFGVIGMADVLAFPDARVLWIETKTRTGKQSPFQRSFQAQVERAGHRYIVARSIEDVRDALARKDGVNDEHV